MDFKDTHLGKGYRTAVQAALAILPLVITILSTEELRTALSGFTWYLILMPVLAGVLSYLQNSAGK